MKKIAAAIALTAASLATPALAADMPVKAVPRIQTAYDWSGIYGGLNIGWVRQKETWTYTNPIPATPPTSSPHDIRTDRAVVGGHVGLQYQFKQIVLGIEGAISTPFSPRFAASDLQCVAVAGSLCEAEAKTLLTAGGRLGWAWNRWLVYGTGGWAQLRIATREVTVPPVVFDVSQTHRHTGFYVGGGVEYALTENLIAGLEYQHVDVGTLFHASSADGIGGFGPAPPGANGRNVDGGEDIVRARLSVKFGVPGLFAMVRR